MATADVESIEVSPLIPPNAKEVKESLDKRIEKIHFPRIVVRDKAGRRLDTFTSLQEAIYRDRWNVRSSQEAVNPGEWRLPQAPLPSKPDYSRRGPRISKSKRHSRSLRTAQSEPPGSVEIGVEDAGFVVDSIRQLPELSFFNRLHGNFTIGDKVYFQIVARILLHRKLLSETDKRDTLYVFPGFCTGCQRSGLCYGCEKGLGPHVHEDKPIRTGGGFTYWKRDRPEKERQDKNPASWPLKISEKQIRQLIDAERTMSAAAQSALRKRIFAQYPWLEDIPLDSTSLNYLREMGILTKGGEGFKEFADGEDEGIVSETSNYREDTDLYVVPKSRLDGWLSEGKGSSVLDSGREQKYHSQGQSHQQQLHTSRDGDKLEGWKDTGEESANVMGESIDEEDGLSSANKSDLKSSRPRLYKAPKAFRIKSHDQRETVSRSPFSTNRQYNISKGNGFQIKKSNRAVTQFVDFERSGSSWKEPKKFELKSGDRKKTEFWQPSLEKKGKRQNLQNEDIPAGFVKRKKDLDQPISPDSGLDSEFVSESVKDSTVDTFPDSAIRVQSETDPEVSNGSLVSDNNQYDSEKEPSTSQSPLLSPSPTSKSRKPIVKKTKSPIQTRPQFSPKPPPPPPEPEVEEEPPVEEPTPEPPSREPTKSPELVKYVPDVSLPDLPDIVVEKKEEKQKQKKMFFVEAPPEMTEPPKKRKSPPKVRRLPKMHYRRKSRPAEAPISTEKLQDMQDPLDFLAKYCIINPNRLPFYQLIFESGVADQSPRYDKPNLTTLLFEREKTVVSEEDVTDVQPQISEHELKLVRDMTVINREGSSKIGLSPPEEYLEKVIYTLETLHSKFETLGKDLSRLEERKISQLASQAKVLFPDVAVPNYVPPEKKKGKKGKGLKETSAVASAVRLRYGMAVPDHIIVDRLNDAMMAALNKEPEIRQINLETERTQEKISSVLERMEQLKGEKILLEILSSDYYYDQQTGTHRPAEFRRQQSELYNKLRPEPDYEMNLEEVEEALQQINNHLLTNQEFKYLYFILNLPGRTRISFRLFSVIAALSEKVTQLDPVIRKLLNKFDYNALDVKMEKCKELFCLLHDDELSTPRGGASATSLALELTAGGLKPEHTNFVLSKFNREGKGLFDFMDFVTYIPLFIEIHQRICRDPLCEEQDL